MTPGDSYTVNVFDEATKNGIRFEATGYGDTADAALSDARFRAGEFFRQVPYRHVSTGNYRLSTSASARGKYEVNAIYEET